MNSQVISKVTRLAGRTVLKLKKISPELMLGFGIAGIVGAGIWACVNTFKNTKDIVEETHEELDKIEESVENNRLPEAIERKAVFKIYTRQTWKLVRNYVGPLALGGASLALIVGSHCVLNRRYLGATAAYKAVEEAYRAYRDRVRAAVGEEEEKNLYLNTSNRNDIPVNEIDPNTGESVVSTKSGVVVNPNFKCSQYARFFDESSNQWQKDPEYNLMFLRAQENYANNLLNARGHLFLNEVYDMLGIPRSQAGAVVGWIKDSNHDGYVDFGLYNVYRDVNRGERVRDFVNGYERSVLLDFNVDGIIYDKI